MERHFSPQYDLHDHAGVGEVVVVCGVVGPKLDLEVELWQADVLVDVVPF